MIVPDPKREMTHPQAVDDRGQVAEALDIVPHVFQLARGHPHDVRPGGRPSTGGRLRGDAADVGGERAHVGPQRVHRRGHATRGVSRAHQRGHVVAKRRELVDGLEQRLAAAGPSSGRSRRRHVVVAVEVSPPAPVLPLARVVRALDVGAQRRDDAVLVGQEPFQAVQVLPFVPVQRFQRVQAADQRVHVVPLVPPFPDDHVLQRGHAAPQQAFRVRLRLGALVTARHATLQLPGLAPRRVQEATVTCATRLLCAAVVPKSPFNANRVPIIF